jgi:hypothetical protein
MWRESMGREGLVTRGQAAKILGVSPRHVSRLARSGKLTRTFEDGQPIGGEELFSEEEVSAYAELREKGSNPAEVAAMAQQAWAAARAAQRRVELLEKLLGLNVSPLENSREAILALRALAEEDLGRHINGEAKVNFWADQLFRMCDIYIEDVREQGFEVPYEPYLSLCHQLLIAEDHTDDNPVNKLAYKRLRLARVKFRESIFTYYLRTEGKKRALARFPSEFQGLHYDVMMLATTASSGR